MSHASKRRHKFYVPSAYKNEMNDNLEKRVRIKALKAFAGGARYFESQGLLFVWCDGEPVLWEKADPKLVGRK
jgi:hypothetical protein